MNAFVAVSASSLAPSSFLTRQRWTKKLAARRVFMIRSETRCCVANPEEAKARVDKSLASSKTEKKISAPPGDEVMGSVAGTASIIEDKASSVADALPVDGEETTTLAKDVPFEIRGFSLANLFLLAGATVTVVSFSSYFGSNATASATSLGFVYGVPILLIGCALKYAELQPVPLRSTPDGRALRSTGTEIQQKIVSDITRHRYGDEAHLSAALSSLGLIPRGAACPELISASESSRDGKYCLTLQFYSVETPWKTWEGKIDRYERFFGPGIKAEVEKLDGEKRLVALKLIASD